MKQYRRVLIAGVALILLIAVTFVVIGLLPRDENDKIVFPKWLITEAEENIARLDVQNAEGGFTVTFDENGPCILGYEGFPLTDETKEKMRKNIGNVYAYDTVDSDGTAADYGLDSPETTVTLTGKNGKSLYLYIGAALPSSDAHYCRVNEDKAVYAVKDDYLYFFSGTHERFISKQVTSIPADSAYLVDYLTVTKQGEPYLAFSVMDESEKEHYNSAGLFKMTVPYSALGRDVNVISYLNKVCNLTAASIEALDTEPETLARFGLDAPGIVIEYSYRGEKTRLLLSDVQDGFCRLYKEGGNIVYTILAQKLELINFDALDYVSVNQFKRDINAVSRIIFRLGGREIPVDVAVTDGKTEAMIAAETIDGKAFEALYEKLISSEVVGAAENPGTSPLLTCVFRYGQDTGMANDTVSFRPIDDRTVFLEINGGGNFYVSAAYVTELIAAVNSLSA